MSCCQKASNYDGASREHETCEVGRVRPSRRPGENPLGGGDNLNGSLLYAKHHIYTLGSRGRRSNLSVKIMFHQTQNIGKSSRTRRSGCTVRR
jgi:hypothetical protein